LVLKTAQSYGKEMGERILGLGSFSSSSFRKKKQKIAPTEICLVSAAKNRAKIKPPLRSGRRGLRDFLTHKSPRRFFTAETGRQIS
jgi:hypothetical protein